MSIPIAWPEAQRICDIPEVREALDKFAADAHDENMLAMVSAIMGAGSRPYEWTEPVSLGSVNRDYDQGFADGCSESKRLNEHLVSAFVQGRAAGLEEAAKWIDARLGNFMSQYGYDDSEAGALEFGRGAQADAKREYVGELEEIAEGIRAISPTSSDAGKDDARDAARYRWMMGDNERAAWVALSHLCAEEGPIKPQMDAAIDAALSSLEVIGKGEKG